MDGCISLREPPAVDVAGLSLTTQSSALFSWIGPQSLPNQFPACGDILVDSGKQARRARAALRVHWFTYDFPADLKIVSDIDEIVMLVSPHSGSRYQPRNLYCLVKEGLCSFTTSSRVIAKARKESARSKSPSSLG